MNGKILPKKVKMLLHFSAWEEVVDFNTNKGTFVFINRKSAHGIDAILFLETIIRRMEN